VPPLKLRRHKVGVGALFPALLFRISIKQLSLIKRNKQPTTAMAISICAFNSVEMSDEELVKDGLNLFVDWDLSDMFRDLTLRRELVRELAELDQIGKIVNVDVDPIYAMSVYWDKAAEEEHLSYFNTEDERTKQLKIIQANNENLINNVDLVYKTIVALESKISSIDNLDKLLVDSNDDFFKSNTYFCKAKDDFSDCFYTDIKKIREFLEFVKPLGGDTAYFKYK
jgi:hypothetical protein